MEKAPSHSGMFLNVPLKRWVSRVRDLVGANWQVISQSMIWWAGESTCTELVVHLRHCHQSGASLQQLGPGLSYVQCQPLSWKGQKYSINN